MKKISNYAHPTRTKFPQIPPGMEEPLKVIGLQIRELTELNQGQHTPEGNGNAELREVVCQHDTPFLVQVGTVKGAPQGLVVLWTSVGEHPLVKDFAVVSERTVRLRFFWQLSAPAGDVTVRFRLEGG